MGRIGVLSLVTILVFAATAVFGAMSAYALYVQYMDNLTTNKPFIWNDQRIQLGLSVALSIAIFIVLRTADQSLGPRRVDTFDPRLLFVAISLFALAMQYRLMHLTGLTKYFRRYTSEATSTTPHSFASITPGKMQVEIDHNEKPMGFFNKRTMYGVSVAVHFTEEQKAIIKLRRLEGVTVIKRDQDVKDKRYFKELERDGFFNLTIGKLKDGYGDIHYFNTPSQAKQYQEEVEVGLTNLSAYLADNAEIGTRKVFEI